MEKIWLKAYPEGVPADINPDHYRSLVHVLEHSCDTFADRPSYMNLGHSISYAELDKLSQAFASYLQNTLHLKKGDRVMLMMPNLLQYPVALFGILRAGMIAVNTNPLYTPDELLHQVNDSGAETIVVLSNFAQTLEKALPKTKLRHIIVTEIGDCLGFPKKQIVNFVVRYIKKMIPPWKIRGTIPFNRVLEEGSKTTFNRVDVIGEDVAFLQYTGGTTGISKGAVLTHRNMVANLEQASAWIQKDLIPGKEIVVTALPLYHIFSLTANCLVFMKIGGMNLLITNPRDIKNFIKEIANTEFTAFTGVNTLFNALLHNTDIYKVDFSKLKFALAGGMALQKPVSDAWRELTRSPIVEAYGLTETSPGVCINPLTMDHFNGAIGLPLPSTDIQICDDDGEPLPIGESGELCIKGPQVMREYWNKPEETAKVFSADGWLKTGDIAKIDEEGFVYVVDRKKDMVIVSGFNVYPNEIEQIIAQHPGVLEVGVVGVPSEESGEKVKAFIVKKDPRLTKASIIAHCRQYLTSYKIPKAIEFVDELPKTNVGKILRRKLR